MQPISAAGRSASTVVSIRFASRADPARRRATKASTTPVSDASQPTRSTAPNQRASGANGPSIG